MSWFAIRPFKARGIVTDNVVFRLHYKLTTTILIVFGLIILFRQYIGNPIHCFSTYNYDIPNAVLNSYCWRHSTFSIEDASFKDVGDEIPYPGIGKYTSRNKKIYNRFYQWVGFALLFQAFWFYMPHYIWKRMESRRINYIMEDLNIAKYVPENRHVNKGLLSDYFVSKFHEQMLYCACHAMCEILNVVNVIVQLGIMTACLGGTFGNYGLMVSKYIRWNGSSEISPMVQAFPGLAMCTFRAYGSSGDVMKYHLMCALPINGISEKMYLFLWFWFIILGVVSFLAVIYRVVLFVVPQVRNIILLTRAKIPQEDSFKALLNNCDIGDWFMLDLMCTNLDSVSFRDVIGDITLHLGQKEAIHL